LHSMQNVARMDNMRNGYAFLIGKPEGKGPLRYQGVKGRIILS